jgi:hypothetical protein
MIIVFVDSQRNSDVKRYLRSLTEGPLPGLHLEFTNATQQACHLSETINNPSSLQKTETSEQN